MKSYGPAGELEPGKPWQNGSNETSMAVPGLNAEILV